MIALIKRIASIITAVGIIFAFLFGITTFIFSAGGAYKDYQQVVQTGKDNSASIASAERNLSAIQKDVNDLRLKVDAPTVPTSSDESAERPLQSRSPIEVPPFIAQLSGLQGGSQYPDSLCPDGQYVAGIRASGSPGSTKYCIGCLVNVQAICKPLPAR